MSEFSIVKVLNRKVVYLILRANLNKIDLIGGSRVPQISRVRRDQIKSQIKLTSNKFKIYSNLKTNKNSINNLASSSIYFYSASVFRGVEYWSVVSKISVQLRWIFPGHLMLVCLISVVFPLVDSHS